MKHSLQITLILLSMFLITQFIGLVVINAYLPKQKIIFDKETNQQKNITITPQLPYGMSQSPPSQEVSLFTFIFSFLFAIFIIILLMKINAASIIRLWFFFVVVIAIAISINSFFIYANLNYKYLDKIALVLAIILSYYKIFRRDLLIHNLTELLIYPGIAAVFVSFLSVSSTILLLLLISIYDVYAVWYSGFMQKMVKFQTDHVKIFSGFFVPYVNKKTKQLLRNITKTKKNLKKKFKIEVAILGGGDVIFPIIFAGTVMKIFGIFSAILISIFSTISLGVLFILSKKGKFYPAMPFLTIGCLFGFLIVELIKFI